MIDGSKKEGFSGPTPVMAEIRAAAEKTYPDERGYSRWVVGACVDRLEKEGHRLPANLPIGQIVARAKAIGLDVEALLGKELRRAEKRLRSALSCSPTYSPKAC